MIRLLLYLLLIYYGYRLVKWFAANYLLSSERGREPVTGGGGDLQETELVKDPYCGVYFLKNKGVEAKVDDRTVYFCSEDCRRSYLEKKQ